MTFSYARETHKIASYIYCIEAHRLNAAIAPNYFNIQGQFFTPLSYEYNSFINLKASDEYNANYIIKSFNQINSIVANNQIQIIDSFIIEKYADYINTNYSIHEQFETNSGYTSTSLKYQINNFIKLKLIYEFNSFWIVYNRFMMNSQLFNVKYASMIESKYHCSEPYNIQYSLSSRIICHKQFLNTHPDKQLVHLTFNNLRVRQND